MVLRLLTAALVTLTIGAPIAATASAAAPATAGHQAIIHPGEGRKDDDTVTPHCLNCWPV